MTKERLRKYRDLRQEELQIKQQIQTIEAALYSPRAQQLTGMPHGPGGGNPVEDMAAKHLELLDCLYAKQRALAEEQIAIEIAIDGLEPVARTMLRYRYISGMTWEEVCVAMNYSWRQVHRTHSKALKQLRGEEGKE